MTPRQPPGTKRTALKKLMQQTVANERNWHYKFARPLTLPTIEQAVHGTVYADCSFGVKALCHLVPGIPDPTGTNYSGWGNSTTIYLHLPHIPLGDIQVGDLTVYGYEGNQHATMVYTPGRSAVDTEVWSHGQEAGPIITSLASEIRAHPGVPVTHCRLLAPEPPPPIPPNWYTVALQIPPMWAWFSWRDHNHPAGLRPPHVPRLIPPAWWIRYRRHIGAGDPM